MNELGYWRRGWGSNPRSRCQDSSFETNQSQIWKNPNPRIQPAKTLIGAENSIFESLHPVALGVRGVRTDGYKKGYTFEYTEARRVEAKANVGLHSPDLGLSRRAVRSGRCMIQPLTGKREKFCQLVAAGSTYTDAYLEAYQKPAGYDRKGAAEEGSRLMAVSNIVLRVQELRRPVLRKFRRKLEYSVC
jgi:hypothetical protein